MSSFANKLRVLFSTRGMKAAYARWFVARLTTGKSPVRNFGRSVRIGGWVNFSEYWSFREAVSEPEQIFMRSELQRRRGQAIAFDVGANIGAFTCLLAEVAKEVHAFEPIPETFCRLKQNVALNGFLDRCRLNCMAIGERSGLVNFRIQENSPATNRVLPKGKNPILSSLETLASVATVGLDEYCRIQNTSLIDFLKVDVEGMEPLVLQGARELLGAKRVGAVMIEICPANLCTAGFSPSLLFDEITRSGYGPYAIAASGEPGGKVSLAEIESMTLQNILLLPSRP